MGNACDCGMSRGGKALPPAAPAGEQKIASGFRYFAYGSNLCGDRLRMRNKSARLVGTARLDGYRLDFTLSSLTWRGAAADIVADEGGVVWGVVWELDEEDAASLDGQEGVWRVQGDDHGGAKGHASVPHGSEQRSGGGGGGGGGGGDAQGGVVAATLAGGDGEGWVDVGSYKRLDVEVVGGPGGDTTYACRTYEVVNKDLSGLLPSPAYKGVICFGAGEVGLPDDYRAGLQAVAVNDFEGPYKVGYDKWVWYASNEYQKVCTNLPGCKGKKRKDKSEPYCKKKSCVFSPKKAI